MGKMLIGMAAGIAALVGLVGVANAGGVVVQRSRVVAVGRPHSHGHPHIQNRSVVSAQPYYRTHGSAYRGSSYYFAGQNHNHWGHRVWDARYSRYNYWEPSLRAYYYYDASQSGYYPCSCACQ